MAKAHAVVQGDQLLGARQALVDVQVKALGGPEEQQRVAGRLGGGNEQEQPRRVRHPLDAASEALLDPGRERTGARQAEAARQLRRVAAPRQLQQRQRVATGLGDDAVSDPIVQRSRDHRLEQRSRVFVAETVDDELGQPADLAVVPQQTRREDDGDRFGAQAPCDEPEDLGRRPVEPLRVVDQTQERPFAGGFAEEAEHGQADQEAIRRLARPQAERRGERVALRAG